MRDRLTLPIVEASQIADARRQVAQLSRQLGFDETTAGRVSLAVTELAGNLVKHTARGGELLVWAEEEGGVPAIEILSLDKGPGIDDVAEALRDG